MLCLKLQSNYQVNFLLHSTVPQTWVRESIAPASAASSHCISWMDQYFNDFGDHQPHKSEIRLSVRTKTEVYEQYCVKAEAAEIEDCVSLSTFNRLWNGLFPEVVLRSFVDIPGKCETCAKIDCFRKKATNRRTQRLLAETHLMHRGGNFQPERLA